MIYLYLAIGGIVGTALMTMLMKMAPKMGMPEMDIPGMLGGMFGGNNTIGMVMHFMIGIIMAFVYWQAPVFIAGNVWLDAVVFGIVLWLIVGAIMGIMPKIVSAMPDNGFYMMNNGGIMAFMGGALGHIVYALGVVLTGSIIG